MQNKDRQRIVRALRDVVFHRRNQDVPTVLAALRVELGELDKIDPPKVEPKVEDDAPPERKERRKRDRQQGPSRDRGTT